MTEQQMSGMDNKFYRETYEEFKEQAKPLFHRGQELKQQARADVDSPAEERESRYMQRYRDLEESFHSLAQSYADKVIARKGELESKLYDSEGSGFASRLSELASVPDERLEDLRAAAHRSGEKSLEKAAALTGYQRGGPEGRKTFNRWAQANPEVGEAAAELNSLPDLDTVQLHLFRSLKPPKADGPGDLEPTAADRQEAERKVSIGRAQKAAFYANSSKQAPDRYIGRSVR